MLSLFWHRMLRAALLESSFYEEVEHDTTVTRQSMLVVIFSSIAQGVGNGLDTGVISLVLNTIFALVGWLLWAGIIYMIGTRLFPQSQTEADLGQLLRTIGFAAAPGIIRIIGVIPVLRGPVFFIATIWMLTAMIVAVRQALDYSSTLRAILVCVIGWFVYLLLISIMGISFL